MLTDLRNYAKMPDLCYINGKIVPPEEASIGIKDIGLLRGYACFDFFRTYNGKPFRLPEHLQRFRSSADELHLPVKQSDTELTDLILDLLKQSGKQEAGIRLVLTGGYATDSMSISEPNFIVSIEDLPGYSKEIYESGVKLITSEYQRGTPRSKTTEYLNAVRLEPLKKEQGAFDILYYFGEEVLEITRHNFFIFKDGALVTPKEHILLGITRQLVIELADGHFPIDERKVHIDELKQADEAFCCGTTKAIVPVVKIDDFTIGNGKVGANTRQLMELFNAYVNA